MSAPHTPAPAAVDRCRDHIRWLAGENWPPMSDAEVLEMAGFQGGIEQLEALLEEVRGSAERNGWRAGGGDGTACAEPRPSGSS